MTGMVKPTVITYLKTEGGEVVVWHKAGTGQPLLSLKGVSYKSSCVSRVSHVSNIKTLVNCLEILGDIFIQIVASACRFPSWILW